MYYSILGIIALFVGILSTDNLVSVYAFCSVGLFCSTLWPCIFTLAITGLGRHTSNGSNFLIFMIMGGGIVSLLQGWLSDDKLLGISWSYLVGVACFIYLVYYAIEASKELKKQGYNLDEAAKTSGGH
jgi:FHS family L-fucose permease-like MFS transporter